MSLLFDIKYQIVAPVVEALALPGDAVARMQITTGIWNRESGLAALTQAGGGPALGFGQMEPATHDDLWRSYLPAHPELQAVILRYLPARFAGQPIGASAALIESLPYAAAMTTLAIRRSPYALAARGDATGQCQLWKNAYNSALGAGVVNAASISLFQQAINA